MLISARYVSCTFYLFLLFHNLVHIMIWNLLSFFSLSQYYGSLCARYSGHMEKWRRVWVLLCVWRRLLGTLLWTWETFAISLSPPFCLFFCFFKLMLKHIKTSPKMWTLCKIWRDGDTVITTSTLIMLNVGLLMLLFTETCSCGPEVNVDIEWKCKVWRDRGYCIWIQYL